MRINHTYFSSFHILLLSSLLISCGGEDYRAKNRNASYYVGKDMNVIKEEMSNAKFRHKSEALEDVDSTLYWKFLPRKKDLGQEYSMDNIFDTIHLGIGFKDGRSIHVYKVYHMDGSEELKTHFKSSALNLIKRYGPARCVNSMGLTSYYESKKEYILSKRDLERIQNWSFLKEECLNMKWDMREDDTKINDYTISLRIDTYVETHWWGDPTLEFPNEIVVDISEKIRDD